MNALFNKAYHLIWKIYSLEIDGIQVNRLIELLVQIRMWDKLKLNMQFSTEKGIEENIYVKLIYTQSKTLTV